MQFEGNLTITKDNVQQYTSLTKISGSLIVEADFSTSMLTTVCGDLFARANFEATALEEIKGDVFVHDVAFSVPKLAMVGGYLLCNGSEFLAPNLTVIVDGVIIRPGGKML